MDVLRHDGAQTGGTSGWKYRYVEEKAESAACKAMIDRAAANFPVSKYDPKEAKEANKARPAVVSAYEATQAAHRDAAGEAARLGEEYRRLRALYDDRNYGPYRSQRPAYLAGLDGYPAYEERFEQAQATGVATYNAFRDRYRETAYPSTYDWDRGGDQGLWAYSR